MKINKVDNGDGSETIDIIPECEADQFVLKLLAKTQMENTMLRSMVDE